jgi:hypothetical protein
LPFDANREDTPHIGLFRTEIIKRCDSWLEFAKGFGIDRMEELVLVTGCDRTQSWALAAFMESNASAGISFDLSLLSGIASAPVIKWKFTRTESRNIPYNYGQLSYV